MNEGVFGRLAGNGCTNRLVREPGDMVSELIAVQNKQVGLELDKGETERHAETAVTEVQKREEDYRGDDRKPTLKPALKQALNPALLPILRANRGQNGERPKQFVWFGHELPPIGKKCKKNLAGQNNKFTQNRGNSEERIKEEENKMNSFEDRKRKEEERKRLILEER